MTQASTQVGCPPTLGLARTTTAWLALRSAMCSRAGATGNRLYRALCPIVSSERRLRRAYLVVASVACVALHVLLRGG